MKMTNGEEVIFTISELDEYVVVRANEWSLLIIRKDGSSALIDCVRETSLNLDKEGRLAIDQPLPKPPVERFR